MSPCTLLVAPPGAAAAAEAALHAIEARYRGPLLPDDAGERLEHQCVLDLLAVEASAIDGALLDRLLPRIAHHARNPRTRVVVTLHPDQIDTVAGELLGTPAVLLCEPSLPERVAALATRRPQPDNALRDMDRSGDTAQLARLSEEVERIARTLARLTGSDAPGSGSSERGGGFVPPVADVPIDAGLVRAAIRARRLREHFIDRNMLGEPGWDILLDLFAAELEQLRVSVSSLCIAAAVPPTTALRWISGMTEAGMLERRADTRDRRRAFVTLAEGASVAMRNYFAALQRQGLPFG